MIITSLIVAGPAQWFMLRLMDYFDAPLRSYGTALTARFGDTVGGALAGLSVALALIIPLLLWAAGMLAIARRFGVRCPHCRRSLTARYPPRRVLASGECPLCHNRVLEESHAE